MKRKLTIRRVGNHIPTITLVGFLFLCITLAWLSFVGLPGSLLRKIEQAAANEGIYLQLASLHLEPSRGLAVRADNIVLYPDKEVSAALLKAKSITIGLSFSELFKGKLAPGLVELKNARANLPVTNAPDAKLKLRNINLTARTDSSGNLNISTAALHLHGIVIRMSGEITDYRRFFAPASTVGDAQTSQPINIPALLEQYAPYTDKAYQIIENQKWTAQEAPEVRLDIVYREKLTAIISGEIPRYDFDIFHIRNTRLNLSYKDDTITINNLAFDTIDPPSTVSLQAAFARESRELGFNFESDASLIPMLTQALGDDAGILKKITHKAEHAPHISLTGSVSFGEDYTLSKVRLNGELVQKQLLIGERILDQLKLVFYYNDGNFNINQLELNFGNNHLSLNAAANNGMGTAELRADLHIEQTLALVNEFTPEPISIPEQYTVGERLKLRASAALTTPDFKAGKKEWQHFTPNIHNLDIEISLNHLQTKDIELTAPALHLQLAGLTQTEHKVPTGADKLAITLTADEVTAADYNVHKPAIKIAAEQISYTDDILNIGSLAFTPAASHSLSQLTIAGLCIRDAGLQTTISELKWEDNLLTIGEVSGNLSVATLTHGDIQLGQVELNLAQVRELTLPAAPPVHLFAGADLTASVGEITYEGRRMGNLKSEISVAEGRTGKINMALFIPSTDGKDTAENTLAANVDWTNTSRIKINDIELKTLPASFDGILEHFKIDIPQIRLPNTLSATGSLICDTESGKAEDVKIKLIIPELIRKPLRVKAFAGEEINIGLTADITMNPSAGEGYDYDADLHITHGSNEFTGQINGSTEGKLHVTGSNTIRADVIDRLIDSQTAHAIIRDFRFRDNSRNIVTAIDVTVDYSNGLSVDTYCNAELVNVGYQLAVIEEDAAGNEKLRTDLGKNPYTIAEHATCYVRTKVRYDVLKNGKPTKDECAVTIGNITMNYNNSEWLRRQDFTALGYTPQQIADIRKRHKTTTLLGDAVIIDVENSFVELVNVRGCVYPSYSLGMFYAPLHEFLGDIVMPHPADIETKSCVFPIYSDCKRPMSGSISAASKTKCGFRFLGTTIPLHNFSGFIHLTDDYVLLDKMNAASWEGVLDAVVKIGFRGKRTSFDGMINARNMNLKSILASYNTEFKPALCNGFLRFRAPSPDLNDIQGYGEVHVENGDLMGFTLFQPIGDLVTDLPAKLLMLETAAKNETIKQDTGYISKVFSGTGDMISSIGNKAKIIPGYNHIFAYDIQDAFAKFVIADGKLRAYDMKALGYNLNVDMKLSIDLETLYIRGNLWPKITSLPTVILSPLTFLSDFMIDILIFGEIDDLNWKFGLDRNLKGEPPSVSSKKGDKKYKPVSEKKKAS